MFAVDCGQRTVAGSGAVMVHWANPQFFYISLISASSFELQALPAKEVRKS